MFSILFNLLKIKYSLVMLVIYQVLNPHIWLVANILQSADLWYQKKRKQLKTGCLKYIL